MVLWNHRLTHCSLLFLKGDNEGELDEGFCDELADDGFAQLLVQDDFADSVMIPTTNLLEDFDLGVDMLDSTEQTIPTSEPLKSPFGQIPMAPGSPYQLVATSSPVAIPPQDIQSQNNYNEYLNQAHSDASSTSSYSQHSGYMPTEGDDLALLFCEGMTDSLDVMATTAEVLSLPVSTAGQYTTSCSTIGMEFSSHPVSYSNSSFTSQADPSFSTPTLASVNMSHSSLMDLAEASQLLLGDGGINTGLINMTQLGGTPIINQTSSATTPVASDSNFSAMSSESMSIPLSNVTSSMAGAQMCSRSSQTCGSDTNRLTRSLSPAPSISNYSNQCHSPSPSPSVDHFSIGSVSSVSTGACYYSPSPESNFQKNTRGSSRDRLRSSSPSPSKSSRKMSPLPASKDKLVEMPFYQFKKILDDPNVDVNEKEEAKNIRKRGKNKVAAKNCRQKKIEVVMGLQQEVDQMKEQKKLLAKKCQGLQREIHQLKQKCMSFRSLAHSSS